MVISDSTIYSHIYATLMDYVFGGELTSSADIACSLLSAIGSIFVYIVPFLVVYKLVCLILGV